MVCCMLNYSSANTPSCLKQANDIFSYNYFPVHRSTILETCGCVLFFVGDTTLSSKFIIEINDWSFRTVQNVMDYDDHFN
jgi:hypothetical protein